MRCKNFVASLITCICSAPSANDSFILATAPLRAADLVGGDDLASILFSAVLAAALVAIVATLFVPRSSQVKHIKAARTLDRQAITAAPPPLRITAHHDDAIVQQSGIRRQGNGNIALPTFIPPPSPTMDDPRNILQMAPALEPLKREQLMTVFTECIRRIDVAADALLARIVPLPVLSRVLSSLAHTLPPGTFAKHVTAHTTLLIRAAISAAMFRNFSSDSTNIRPGEHVSDGAAMHPALAQPLPLHVQRDLAVLLDLTESDASELLNAPTMHAAMEKVWEMVELAGGLAPGQLKLVQPQRKAAISSTLCTCAPELPLPADPTALIHAVVYPGLVLAPDTVVPCVVIVY